jgi:hypothetical protein
MSYTITVPDDLYLSLEGVARRRGVSIEELLRLWPILDQGAGETELRARDAAVQRSVELYKQLRAGYGLLGDSTESIRDDRSR